MKVILREDVTKLGDAGHVVTVRDGYARNFLVPRGLAYVATEGALKKIEQEMKLRARRIEVEKGDLQAYANKLEGVTVTIPMKVGEEDRLYGSVTNQMLAESLGNQGFDIDRRQIVLDEPIKTLGAHEVPVHFKHGVTGKFRLNVISE
jgi:large subunit ribosomal protein L9